MNDSALYCRGVVWGTTNWICDLGSCGEKCGLLRILVASWVSIGPGKQLSPFLDVFGVFWHGCGVSLFVAESGIGCEMFSAWIRRMNVCVKSIGDYRIGRVCVGVGVLMLDLLLRVFRTSRFGIAGLWIGLFMEISDQRV